ASASNLRTIRARAIMPDHAMDSGGLVNPKPTDPKPHILLLRPTGHDAARGSRVERRVGAVPRAARVSDERTLLPGQPHDDDGPLFREPWEAQAFAMTLALHEHG